MDAQRVIADPSIAENGAVTAYIMFGEEDGSRSAVKKRGLE
jgi:hypothetical protein